MPWLVNRRDILHCVINLVKLFPVLFWKIHARHHMSYWFTSGFCHAFMLFVIVLISFTFPWLACVFSLFSSQFFAFAACAPACVPHALSVCFCCLSVFVYLIQLYIFPEETSGYCPNLPFHTCRSQQEVVCVRQVRCKRQDMKQKWTRSLPGSDWRFRRWSEPPEVCRSLHLSSS